MSTTVFLAILVGALLHASWNALIKLGTSKMTSMLIMSSVQGVVGLVVAMTRELPTGEVWLWLLASGVLHATYKLFLSYAYEQGDLSRVYPIARGTAPMLVLLLSGAVLADAITGLEYIGIIVLGIGIITMARGVWTSGESRKLVPFALCSAMATAGYSIVDGLGARVLGDAATFVAWMFFLDAIIFAPVAMGLKGRGIWKADIRSWTLGALAALASYGAYAIAVWAMTKAPIALVTALRETSILFAVLIGVIFFKEKITRGKLMAAGLIVLGVALTRI